MSEANVKSYGVVYNVEMNPGEAIEKLGKIALLVQRLAGDATKAQQAVQAVQNALSSLSMPKIVFEFNSAAFEKQLKLMEGKVNAAAARMSQALRNGMTGNAKIEKAVLSNAADKAFNSPRALHDAIRTTRNELAQAQKAIQDNDKIINSKKKSISADARANAQILRNEARAKSTVLQEQLKAYQRTLGEKVYKDPSWANERTTKAAGTPSLAQLRQIEKMMGGHKSRTFRLAINADITPFQEKMAQVVAKIESLKAIGAFELNPTINNNAFKLMESQLLRLRTLAQEVAAPFVGNKVAKIKPLTQEQTQQRTALLKEHSKVRGQIAAKQQQIAALESKENLTSQEKGMLTRARNRVAELQTKQQGIITKALPLSQQMRANGRYNRVSVIGQLESIINTKAQYTVSVLGKLTGLVKATNKVAGTVGVTAEVIEVLNAVKNLKPILVNAMLSTEAITALNEQLAAFNNNPKNKGKLNVTLNLAQAQEQLKAFISYIQSQKAQLNVTANGKATSGVVGTGSNQKGGVGTGTVGAQTTPIDERRAALRAAADKKAAKQLADNKLRAAKGAEYRSQYANWYAATQAGLNRLFGATSTPQYEEMKRNALQRSEQLRLDKKWQARKAAENRSFERERQAMHNARQNSLQRTFMRYGGGALDNPNDRWYEREQGRVTGLHAARQAMYDRMFAPLTPYEQRAQKEEQARVEKQKKLAEQQRKVAEQQRKLAQKMAAPSGLVGKGVNSAFFGSSPSKDLLPKGYKWATGTNMMPFLNEDQQKGYRQAVAAANKTASRANIAERWNQRQSQRFSNAKANLHNVASNLGLPALTSQLNSLIAQRDAVQAKIASLSKDSSLKAARSRAWAVADEKKLNQQIAQTRSGIASIKWNEEYRNATREVNRNERRYRTSREGARQLQSAADRANNAVTPYTRGYVPVEDKAAAQRAQRSANSIARHQARIHNALMPYAQSQQQLDLLQKHRRFFVAAARETGITPTPAMSNAERLTIMQAAARQMQAANVAVPMALQSQIAKSEAAIAKIQGKSDAAAARAAAPKAQRVPQQASFYDRARKGSYLFTGNTSFGARTPMAVDMAKGMGVMFAIGGAMSAIGNSFSQSMEYQNVMGTTRAILQNGTDSYSRSGFREMEEIVRNVGVSTKFSAPEVASAAKFLAMAGFDINQINHSIRPIADLALIGDLDLGETADKMTNIMTTFGIKAEDMRGAANIMTTTMTRTNTDLMMLAESAKYGGGVAAMYGRKDPNLFADTMALFGVMGNAGIQGSSAGTALRMMYQNLYRPNKNQLAMQKKIAEEYGVHVQDENGQNRSMAEIIMDIARIPATERANVIGSLFRITAQPGAAAAITASEMADKLGVSKDEVAAGEASIDNMLKSVNKLGGLSTLASLMMANRESVSGNISGEISEEKQKLTKGLWAQVTSTFTEGVLKAFESKNRTFDGMLTGLRDYLAKPETVQMINNLLDLIVGIGEMMAKFAGIWAKLYNTFPGIIKFWVVTQMFFTQVGTLMAPFIALTGVVNRLGQVITKVTGLSFGTSLFGGAGASAAGAAATKSAAINAAAGAAGSTAATVAAGSGAKATTAAMMSAATTQAILSGHVKKTVGGASKTGLRALAENGLLIGATAKASSATRPPLAPVGAQQHAGVPLRSAANSFTKEQVNARYKRRFGAAGRIRTGYNLGYSALTRNAGKVLNGALFVQMFGGLKGTFGSIMLGLSKTVGLLLNPITLAGAALVGFGFSVKHAIDVVNGTTQGQIIALQKVQNVTREEIRQSAQQAQWYNNLKQGFIKTPGQNSSVVTDNNPIADRAQQERDAMRSRHKMLTYDYTNNGSSQMFNEVQKTVERIRTDNPLMRAALGEDYYKDVTQVLPGQQIRPLYTGMWGGIDPTLGQPGANFAQQGRVVSQNLRKEFFAREAANSSYVQTTVPQLEALYGQYVEGKLNSKDYTAKANELINNVMSSFIVSRNDSDLSNEDLVELGDEIKHYKQFQDYVRKILVTVGSAGDGTITGKIKSYREFSRGNLEKFSDNWFKALSNIAEDYQVLGEFVTLDGKHRKQLALSLPMLSNGRVNTSQLNSAISDSLGGQFHLGGQQFGGLLAQHYQTMADHGLVTDSKKDQLEYVMKSYAGHKFTTKDLEQYWDEFVSKQSEWIKAGYTKKKYIELMKGQNKDFYIDGRKTSVKEELGIMAGNFARKAVYNPSQIAYDNPYGATTQNITNSGNTTLTVNINGITVVKDMSDKSLADAVQDEVTKGVTDSMSKLFAPPQTPFAM